MDRRWFVVVAFVAVAALVVVPAVSYAAELAGTVKSVKPDAKSAVVTDAAGKDTTVTWDDKTAVTVDGKAGTAADVKAGAKVTVTHEGGKASKIAVSTK
ncbi:MAG: hypothetical protein L0211_15360 [Planctomycetaceae bacterium]|nr:hypothetical protein [Planctomycetaceae bacterium]